MHLENSLKARQPDLVASVGVRFLKQFHFVAHSKSTAASLLWGGFGA